VAYQFLQAGGSVKAVIEALPAITGYSVHAAKIRRMKIPIITSYIVSKALGKEKVEGALICPNRSHKEKENIQIDCDLICIATGLKPSDELCWQAGMDFGYDGKRGGFIPIKNFEAETSIEGIYVAGDVSGVEEASTAMEEGKLAAFSIAKKTGRLDHKEAEDNINETIKRLDALRT